VSTSEIAAIEAAMDALQPFSVEARARMLGYLFDWAKDPTTQERSSKQMRVSFDFNDGHFHTQEEARAAVQAAVQQVTREMVDDVSAKPNGRLRWQPRAEADAEIARHVENCDACRDARAAFGIDMQAFALPKVGS
jgi:hypothetical protein